MKKILLLTSLLFVFSCADLQKLQNKFHQLTHKKNQHGQTQQQVDEIVASEDFVQGSEDIPLVVGMNKISDGALGFDSAAGSIISSSYSTNLKAKDIKDFYLKTLPQMGWTISHHAENSVKFKRDKEDLEIEFVQEDNMQVVRFFYSSLTE